jgi:hypothetical protein
MRNLFHLPALTKYPEPDKDKSLRPKGQEAQVLFVFSASQTAQRALRFGHFQSVALGPYERRLTEANDRKICPFRHDAVQPNS